MKHQRYNKVAFSLIELLMALAVSAIVVAVIAPKYFNIESKAKDVVARNMASELNNTYGEWLTAGGQVSGSAAAVASDGLLALNGTNSGAFANGGNSSNFKFPIPNTILGTLTSANPQGVVNVNGIGVAYDAATGGFAAATLPTNGQPVQVGPYLAELDPGTGSVYSAATPIAGSFITLGNSLVSTNSTGGIVSTSPSTVPIWTSGGTGGFQTSGDNSTFLQSSLGDPDYVYVYDGSGQWTKVSPTQITVSEPDGERWTLRANPGTSVISNMLEQGLDVPYVGNQQPVNDPEAYAGWNFTFQGPTYSGTGPLATY